MSSKKTPKEKRAKLPRDVVHSKGFTSDWDRLTESGRYDMNLLKKAMLLLVAADAPLPAEYKDHPLKGEWDGFRECHIGGDFLLIYKITVRGRHETIGFARTGTHSELFD
jgi:mRNA interferase YafQ